MTDPENLTLPPGEGVETPPPAAATPVWLTPEFVLSAVTKGLSLLLILRLVTAEEATTLSAALTQCVEAGFALAAGGFVVWNWARNRFGLQRLNLELQAQRLETEAIRDAGKQLERMEHLRMNFDQQALDEITDAVRTRLANEAAEQE